MDRRSRHEFRSAPSTRDLDRVLGRAGTGLTAHPQISGRTHTDAEWARPALLDPTNRTVLRPVATRRTEDGWGITSRFHPTFELTGNDFVVPAQNGPDSRFSTRVSSAAPSTSSGYRRPVDGATCSAAATVAMPPIRFGLAPQSALSRYRPLSGPISSSRRLPSAATWPASGGPCGRLSHSVAWQCFSHAPGESRPSCRSVSEDHGSGPTWEDRRFLRGRFSRAG